LHEFLASFKRPSLSSSKKLAISTLAVAVVVFVVIGIAVELVFLPKASTASSPTVTTTTAVYCSSACPPPSTQLRPAVDQWVQDFNTRNVEGLSNFYTTDAAVVWGGTPQAGSLLGTYNGIGNIRILYGSSIGKTTFLNASISNYSEKPTNPSNIDVTLTLKMQGNSTVVGGLTSTITANQEWHFVGGQWAIANENWNYLTFTEQFPVSSTTFPQWTALKAGQNPNLVSEKSFEWNAGPFVAAAVYALLFGVVAFIALRFRSMGRGGRPEQDASAGSHREGIDSGRHQAHRMLS
jgi:hypothetical protein